MKKYYFLVLLLLFTIACAYKNVEIIELRKIADEINDRILKVKYDNFSSIEINDEAKVIIVKLVDDSIKEQIWFKENISDSKYILFKKGKFSNINNNIEYELSRKEKNIVKGYHQYFVNNDRIVYLSNDIDEIYYLNKESKISLKKYLMKENITLDSVINNIADISYQYALMKDGGTTIYKSNNNNITVVVCKRYERKKDIYIGEYNMIFDGENMCNRLDAN